MIDFEGNATVRVIPFSSAAGPNESATIFTKELRDGDRSRCIARDRSPSLNSRIDSYSLFTGIIVVVLSITDLLEILVTALLGSSECRNLLVHRCLASTTASS